MVDLTFGTSGQLVNWVITIGVWLLLFLGMLAGTIGLLWLRKWSKLKYPVLEFIGSGGGKVIVQSTKAGWFKSRWFLGLIDYGGEVKLMTKDRRAIQNASAEDLHDIFAKKGFIVLRKGDDDRVLVPLEKFGVKNKELLSKIAPAEYRDTSLKLMRQSEKEMMTQFERYAPLLVGAVLVMILLIAILFILQYVKHSQTEAWNKLLEAGKLVVNNQANTAPSEAPILIPLPMLFSYIVGKLRSVVSNA